MLNKLIAFRKHSLTRFFSITFLLGLTSASVSAESFVMINGTLVNSPQLPITVIQDKGKTGSNSVFSFENLRDADSLIVQTGMNNSAVVIQRGTNKYAYVEQHGLFNHLLIIQFGSSATDSQEACSDQSASSVVINKDCATLRAMARAGTLDGRPQAVSNYAYTLQTHADGSASTERERVISQAFQSLTIDEAKLVAANFTFAPGLSRVRVNVLEDISQHFSSVVENRLDLDRFSFHSASHADEIKGSGLGDIDGGWGTPFVNVSQGDADRNEILGLSGYKQRLHSATLGSDFKLSPQSRVGVAINYTESNTNVSEGFETIRTKAYQIAGYGAYAIDRYYLDLLGTIGSYSFSSERFADAMKVNSDSGGWGYAWRAQGGYFFGNDKLRFGPLLSVAYTKGVVRGYTEQGNVLLSQNIETQVRERFQESAGVAFNYSDSVGSYPLQAFLKAAAVRDHSNNANDTVRSRFSFDPSDMDFLTFTDEGATDTYRKISAGVNIAINRRSKLWLVGNTLAGTDRIKRSSAYVGLSIIY